MKMLNLALIITALVVYLAGTVWYYIDRNKGGNKKAPMYLKYAGILLMLIYFILLLVRS